PRARARWGHLAIRADESAQCPDFDDQGRHEGYQDRRRFHPQSHSCPSNDMAFSSEAGAPAELQSYYSRAEEGILSYVPQTKDLRMKDGWAVEWGYFTAKFQDPAGEVKTLRGKVLRVLEKQGDGTWKFARVAWSPAE